MLQSVSRTFAATAKPPSATGSRVSGVEERNTPEKRHIWERYREWHGNGMGMVWNGISSDAIHMRVSINGGTPKSSIYRWIFPYKSSYWGNPILGTHHMMFQKTVLLG